MRTMQICMHLKTIFWGKLFQTFHKLFAHHYHHHHDFETAPTEFHGISSASKL